MLAQYILLWIVIYFAAIVPPVLSPLGYSLTGLLVLQNANPRMVLLVVVSIVTLSDITIRFVQNYLIKRWNEYETIENPKWYQRLISKINSYFKKQQNLNRISSKREEYTKTKTGKIATFLFAIFCYLPFIADIISTRLLYKKIKFVPFVIAVIIGKTISHGVFIFVGKSIFQLLHFVK